MFQWHKTTEKLDFPAGKVLHLERSLGDVQVAIPGLPAQLATAYLVVFEPREGVRATIVLHLHTSGRLAFFFDDSGPGGRGGQARVLDAGMQFAESMGFMMGDMDIHRMSQANREKLWNSLPLRNGIALEKEPASAIAVRTPERPPRQRSRNR